MMFLWLWPWKDFYIKEQRHEAAHAKASHINQRKEAAWDLGKNAPRLAKLNDHLVPCWAMFIKGNWAGQLTEIHLNKPGSLPCMRRKQHQLEHRWLLWQPHGTTGEFLCPLYFGEERKWTESTALCSNLTRFEACSSQLQEVFIFKKQDLGYVFSSPMTGLPWQPGSI